MSNIFQGEEPNVIAFKRTQKARPVCAVAKRVIVAVGSIVGKFTMKDLRAACDGMNNSTVSGALYWMVRRGWIESAGTSGSGAKSAGYYWIKTTDFPANPELIKVAEPRKERPAAEPLYVPTAFDLAWMEFRAGMTVKTDLYEEL